MAQLRHLSLAISDRCYCLPRARPRWPRPRVRSARPLLPCPTALYCLRLLKLQWAAAMIGAPPRPWTERLSALVWQLATPHLLRSGLYQAGIQNRSGMRPVIVRVTREPFGERVRLWCPAGIAAEELLSARAILRAACRAVDVQIIRDEKRSHVVTVDVIRRGECPLCKRP